MFAQMYTLFCCFTFLPKIIGFEIDYYYSSPLRSQSENCNFFGNIHCQIKCAPKAGFCASTKCYCVAISKWWDIRIPPKDNFDFNDEIQSDKVPKIAPDDELYALRPTLRHHIAHFCPNLEIARTCIRKCIKLGKPAFCGKDHVCYCGHKYEHTEDENKVEPNEIYAEFKDMYAKYFGTANDGDKE